MDALRGCLAVYVLLGHARWLLWEGHHAWTQQQHEWWSNLIAYASSSLRYGHEAVICFFVLSGFFIHFRWATAAKRVARPDFAVFDYARRRAHRLLPPYALALLVTLLIDTLGKSLFPLLYAASTGDVLLDQNFSRMNFSPESVVAALVMLPGSPGTHFGTNSPLWSLAYEFVYYALYPVWLGLRSRIGVAAYAVGCGLAFGGALLIPHSFTQAMLSMYPLWLAGAALAELTVRQSIGPREIFAAVILAGAGFAGFHFLNGLLVVVPYLAFGIGIVSIASAMPPTITKWWLHRALEWFGLRSYTIYIFHFSLLAFLSAATFSVLGERPSHGWLAVAGSVATIACCHLFWLIGEKRFLHARFGVEAKSGLP